jgi:hypothetical protein
VLKEVPLGEFQPDLAPSHSNHLTVAKNVRAIANGYGPVGSFQAITSTAGAAITGSGSFASSTGDYTFLAATADNLKKYDASWSDVLTLSTSQVWRFAQFGDNVVYANGGQLGRYQLIPGTAEVLAESPSGVIDVATVRDFTFGITIDQAFWSEFNDCTGYEFGENQSDFQPFLDGGPGVRVIGGEYGLIFQKNAIKRVSYAGPPIIFQFDTISPEVGCMAGGSVAQLGRLVFFLSERGFEMCDGQDVTPIADEKVNRWFFDRYSRSDIANISASINPRAPEVWWAMPGTPGMILVYNWLLKRWTTIELDVAHIFYGLTAAIALEALDTLYPEGLDAIPLSLDDAAFAGGNPILMVADSSHVIGSLTGTPLEATVRQDNIELTPGKRSRVRGIRPVTDATNATATVNAKLRAGDGESVVSASSMRLNGKMPVRANGRYLDTTLTIPAEEQWTYIQGAEYEFEQGDGR